MSEHCVMQDHFRHPRLQAGSIDQPHRSLPLGDFRLENGEVILDFSLSYVVHGEMRTDGSNVILCLTPIGSIHHKYDFLIGPGKGLDTDRFCVIVVDAIGNGLTTSPSTSFRQAAESFPRFTIRDMVESQRALLDHLGVRKAHAAFGASMGGMQVLQWAVSYPDRLDRAVALVPMARTTPWSACINEASRRALMADPEWLTESARNGWHAWVAIMQVLAGRTPEAMATECSSPADAIRAIADRALQREATGFRAIDWVYQTYAYDAHDVAGTRDFCGDLAAALASVRARTLIVGAPGDLYNPTSAAEEAALFIPGATFVKIPSIYGHHAANGVHLGDIDFLISIISGFLT
jgi:homoserine O-acetyltransferase/O-succinyltransferase